MKQQFYLKQIGHRGRLKIWLVDGAMVRRDVEPEFSNFGQHFCLKKIPLYEFWIDQEAAPDERRFFIDHLLVEWRLMNEGQSYYAASEAGNRKQQAERKKAGDFKKVVVAGGAPSAEKVRQSLLGQMKLGVVVWLVNGRLVRSVFDIEFTEGGHDLVYGYVPEKEVWVDNDVFTSERPYVLLHELFERSLMAKGLDYLGAHRRASRLEWRARHHHAVLESHLAKLGWQKDSQ